MREDFLHYIWRFKKLNSLALKTVSGNSLSIKNFGWYLGAQGPDFFNAQIIIEGQLWAGNIEMHVNSSDWYLHQHEKDPNYENVILHVVWNYDMPVLRNDGTEIPTLVLQSYVNDSIFNAYKQFNQNPNFIFCENSLKQLNDLDWLIWKEKLIIERLEQFSERIIAELKLTQNNWEEAFYRYLLRAFGLNVNNDVFYEIAKTLPLSILKKEHGNILHIEALLFGQSNLLHNHVEDVYFNTLKQTYDYLNHKYQLEENYLKVNFFKLRPDNFPTIRLSQFATFINSQPFLFDLVKSPESLTRCNFLSNVTTSEYWKSHYVFGKGHKERNKKISKAFYDLLLINTILPFQYVYHQQMGNDILDDVLEHYQNLNTENNSVVAYFKQLKVPINNALDTQAILFLKKNYCNFKKCLNCDVGIKIMNK